MSCTLLLIVYYVFTFRHYFTSSKLVTTDYQRLTEALVQIRNAISILDVVPSITIDKHPCDALPILLCPFLCISFFCWCKGTNNSATEQRFIEQMLRQMLFF